MGFYLVRDDIDLPMMGRSRPEEERISLTEPPPESGESGR
jgi:hypothetical protein